MFLKAVIHQSTQAPRLTYYVGYNLQYVYSQMLSNAKLCSFCISINKFWNKLTVELPVIWDALTFMKRHRDEIKLQMVHILCSEYK